MLQVPRAEVPDMPDRMIAATAVYFDVDPNGMLTFAVSPQRFQTVRVE
jgi:hypothetical protein